MTEIAPTLPGCRWSSGRDCPGADGAPRSSERLSKLPTPRDDAPLRSRRISLLVTAIADDEGCASSFLCAKAAANVPGVRVFVTLGGGGPGAAPPPAAAEKAAGAGGSAGGAERLLPYVSRLAARRPWAARACTSRSISASNDMSDGRCGRESGFIAKDFALPPNVGAVFLESASPFIVPCRSLTLRIMSRISRPTCEEAMAGVGFGAPLSSTGASRWSPEAFFIRSYE